jgi:ACR3 family arsenite efflux pump ArsB
LAERSVNTRRLVCGLGILPVPLLALVVFVIAASQVTTVAGLSSVLMQVLLIFVAYLAFAALLGKTLGRLFQLSTSSARTLTFSFGTRNSFVILPIALMLPEAWQAAVVVIVF